MSGSEDFKGMIQKANRLLGAAKTNLENSDMEGVVNRAYYCVFHTISAALLTKNLTFSSHAQTIGAFNREFVRYGIFPKEFNAIIDRLFMDRMEADYSIHFGLGESRVRRNVADAEKILNACTKYIEQTIGFPMNGKD